MATSLQQDLRRLRKLKLDLERKSEAKKKADEAHKKLQARVFARMEDQEMGSTTLAGTQFTPTTTIRAQIQNREEFEEWARAEADEEHFEEKPRQALLNALVRQRLDDNEELPPGLGFYPQETISQRKT